MDRIEIHEQFDTTAFTESRVDGNVIFNVKLLSEKSRNGRTYSERALKEAATLYKGVAVYFDHPTPREMRERKGVRSVRDLIGEVRNPRKIGKEVRGDIAVLDFGESSPAKFLTAVAEQMPNAVGFSHRARGQITRGDDGDVVESLDRVYAHELVTDPATTSGLFESLQDTDDNDEVDEMKLSELTLEQLMRERPELVKQIAESQDAEAEAATLREQNKELQAKLDAADAEKAERAHKEMVSEKLAEAKLPKRLVTDHFRTQLEEAEDVAAVDALIADRKSLLGAIKGGVKSTERNVFEADDDAVDDDGFSEVTDDVRERLVESIFI